MKTFGLTGGVGMGKSTCASLLNQRGIAVLDTDDISRALTRSGQPALQEIRDAFGAEMLDASGKLRRDALADLVFSDASALRQLEAVLHPKITASWRAQLAEWQSEGVSLAVVVIPLLFETACEGEFQTTVCVACSARTQAERLQARGWSGAHANRRILAQLPVEQKMVRAHHVLWSEGGLDALAEQVDRIFVP